MLYNPLAPCTVTLATFKMYVNTWIKSVFLRYGKLDEHKHNYHPCDTQRKARHTSAQGTPVHGAECFFPERVNGHVLWSKRARVLSRFSRVQLFATLWTTAHQAPLSMEFSRQEYWSGLLCPSPGDLPDPGIKSASLISHALAGGFFFTTSGMWEALGARAFLFKEKILSGIRKSKVQSASQHHF